MNAYWLIAKRTLPQGFHYYPKIQKISLVTNINNINYYK